jgi:hypothetical protein
MGQGRCFYLNKVHWGRGGGGCDSADALLGCALAAQEGNDVALLIQDGVLKGSPSVAALQGVSP